MAASGYTPISLYYSTTASAAPTAGNLVSGELAINITDGKLYYKDNAGAVQLLSTSTTATGTANGVLYLNGSKVATSGSALVFDGTTLSLSPANLTINNSYTLNWKNASGVSTSVMNFYSDNNLYIDNAYGSQIFRIGSSGSASERMRLTSTGLGIGTSSPAVRLESRITTTGLPVTSGTTQTNGVLRLSSSQTTGILDFGSNSGAPWIQATDRTDLSQTYQLLLNPNGGNVGIGTSSLLTKFTVQDTERFELGGGSGFTYAQSVNAARTATVEHRSYGSFLTWGTGAAGSQAERMRLDSSGNLGLGVTPNTWTTYKALQVNSSLALMGDGAASIYGNNAYYNSGWKYANSNYAALYVQNNGGNGAHAWYTAPSGTVGNAITLTQAMTLDASGNLGIGVTSVASKLHVKVTGGSDDTLFSYGANQDNFITAGSSGVTIFRNLGTERARIDSSGNLLVGTTSQITGEKFAADTTGASAKAITARNNAGSGAATIFVWNSATSGDNLFMGFGTEANGAQRGSISYNRTGGLTAYNTTSDYRAKDITGPVENSGALIDSVPVYMGKMKGATQERPMFIAHETPAYAHTGVKDAVDADGNPVYQQMDASALIPVMWAEIQSLRKRLADAGIA